MKTLKVKMRDPTRKMWNPSSADFLTGEVVVSVPDVIFWRRRIKDGTLVLAEEKDEKKKKTGGGALFVGKVEATIGKDEPKPTVDMKFSKKAKKKKDKGELL